MRALRGNISFQTENGQSTVVGMGAIMKNSGNTIKKVLVTVFVILITVPLFILLTTFVNEEEPDNTVFPPFLTNEPDVGSTFSPEPEETTQDDELLASENDDEPIDEPLEPDELTEPDDEEPPDDTEEPLEPEDAPVVNINATDEELSASLAEAASRFNCVAVSLASYDRENGYFTYQNGYSVVSEQRLVEEETKFRVASLTKLTVVILAMSLVESGRLDLDEDISSYLGYEVKNPQFPGTNITSRMLMQHTSSLYDTGAFRSGNITYEADTTRQLLGSTVHRDREPGTQHEYSDFAYIVLGAVCEAVSGKLLDTLAGEVLFNPMGIDAAFAPYNIANKNLAALYNSSHAVSRSVQAQLEHGASGRLGHQQNLAVGNLTITTLDYARILNMLLSGGEYNGIRILSEDSVREIHNTDVKAGFYEQGLSVRFQEAAFLDEGVYWHTGSAYGTFAQFMYCIDTGRIVVIVTTGANGEREANGMIKVCLALSELVWAPS